MDKYIFSEEWVKKNIGQPLSLTKLTQKAIATEINYQFNRLLNECTEDSTPYNEEKLYLHLKSKDFKIVGRSQHFTITIGATKLCFNWKTCQIEGLLANYYPMVKLYQYNMESVKRFIRDFAAIKQVIDKDIAEMQSRFETYRTEDIRHKRLDQLRQSATKVILDNYFGTRGYKYKITYRDDQFSVEANMARGHKMRFTYTYAHFANESTKILDYITQLAELVKTEPIKINVV